MDTPKNGPHIRPVRDLRNNYAELKALIENHEPVFITNNGRGEAVLLNIEDYRAYEEYRFEQYILEAIAESERAIVQPGHQWHDFEDVDRAIRARLEERLREEV